LQGLNSVPYIHTTADFAAFLRDFRSTCHN
jgi:hypothetical protein